MRKIYPECLGKGRYSFTVWAPFLKEVALRIVSPVERIVPLEKGEHGYWHAEVEDVFPGTLYFYRLNGAVDRPDPAGNFQPGGVHGASQIVDHNAFIWDDADWPGIPCEEMILYELHTGTFTPEGSFEAVIGRLDDLRDLGVNAIELMPVAQFPGERNWGYDGTYPFAVQNSYGGPNGLKSLVNVCHKKGFAVVLDVVYNHLGPEGNYLENFGPYFTAKYNTPWGKAINFDDNYSHGARTYFVSNALYWFERYHVDALRLDAIHGIFDMSAKHILEELAEAAEDFSEKKGRKFYLFAESDLNEPKVVRSRQSGGYGIDAQWCDDFHHCLHTLLTSEQSGYYMDFGKIEDLEKSIREGFVYDGRYSAFRNKPHGGSSKNIPARRLVVFSQNHDQVGNRLFGERLTTLIDLEGLKVAAGTVFVSPYIPLLFMGEEYAEDSPFLYFTSHADPDLVKAVREGRRKEFESFKWEKEPPDPQSIDVFLTSKLKWENRCEGKHKVMLNFYQQLMRLRRELPALSNLDKNNLEVSGIEGKKILTLYRWHGKSKIFCIINFNRTDTPLYIHLEKGLWKKLLDSSEAKWMGPGSLAPERLLESQKLVIKPRSFILYTKEALD